MLGESIAAMDCCHWLDMADEARPRAHLPTTLPARSVILYEDAEALRFSMRLHAYAYLRSHFTPARMLPPARDFGVSPLMMR